MGIIQLKIESFFGYIELKLYDAATSIRSTGWFNGLGNIDIDGDF